MRQTLMGAGSLGRWRCHDIDVVVGAGRGGEGPSQPNSCGYCYHSSLSPISLSLTDVSRSWAVMSGPALARMSGAISSHGCDGRLLPTWPAQNPRTAEPLPLRGGTRGPREDARASQSGKPPRRTAWTYPQDAELSVSVCVRRSVRARSAAPHRILREARVP